MAAPRVGHHVHAMRNAKPTRRAGSGGSGLSVRSDDLDSVVELYSEDDLRQEAVAFYAAPTLLGSLRKFKIMASAVLLERHPPSIVSFDAERSQTCLVSADSQNAVITKKVVESHVTDC
jgi:hypothetical protein